MNEKIQLMNDEVKDDQNEIADTDDKVDVFESLVQEHSEVKKYAVGHVIDAGMRVVYNNVVTLIVGVTK